MSHSFITKQELTARLAEHYRTKFMRQLYKILGSFDALGNPVSFVKNMGAGVHDLFYEPAKGMTVSAKEFGKGLGRVSTNLRPWNFTTFLKSDQIVKFALEIFPWNWSNR